MSKFSKSGILLISALALGTPLPGYSSNAAKQCKFINKDLGPLKAKTISTLDRAKKEIKQLEDMGQMFLKTEQEAYDFHQKLLKHEQEELNTIIKNINDLAQKLENEIEGAEKHIHMASGDASLLRANLRTIQHLTGQVADEKNKFIRFLNHALEKEKQLRHVFGDFTRIERNAKDEIDDIVQEFEKNMVCS
jgi:predicted RNase H-like nuclease (RuvC/YqgF family)